MKKTLLGVCVVLFLAAVGILSFTLDFIGGADLPSSVTAYAGKEKKIEQNEKQISAGESITNFTYGPYKTVKSGKYFILIF